MKGLSVVFCACLLTLWSPSQRPAAAPPEITSLSSGIDRANMNTSVSPRADFYQYVNGGWLAKTPLPADKAVYGVFEELADTADANIRTLIETAATQPNRTEGSVAQQVGDFFESFMN